MKRIAVNGIPSTNCGAGGTTNSLKEICLNCVSAIGQTIEVAHRSTSVTMNLNPD